jgi:hypothetical protein
LFLQSCLAPKVDAPFLECQGKESRLDPTSKILAVNANVLSIVPLPQEVELYPGKFLSAPNPTIFADGEDPVPE